MSTPSIASPAVHTCAGYAERADRYEAVRQYSRGQIAALWVAVAAPMAIGAWIVAPWLSHDIGTSEPLATAVMICLNVGLLWILALTLLMVRIEQGGLRWAHVRDALWLGAPQSPRSGRVGGKVWWWLMPFVILSAALKVLPIDPAGPLQRDFPNFIQSDRAGHYYQGAWGLFALSALIALLSPVVEELFFRGLLNQQNRDTLTRHLKVEIATARTDGASLMVAVLKRISGHGYSLPRSRRTDIGRPPSSALRRQGKRDELVHFLAFSGTPENGLVEPCARHDSNVRPLLDFGPSRLANAV